MFRPKMIPLPRNKKQTYRSKSKPQMWPSDLTLAVTLKLNFQGQIWNLLYLGQKLSDCHDTKSKHIDWTLCLKCDHLISSLAMTLTMHFHGQIWNLLYLVWLPQNERMHIELSETLALQDAFMVHSTISRTPRCFLQNIIWLYFRSWSMSGTLFSQWTKTKWSTYWNAPVWLRVDS